MKNKKIVVLMSGGVDSSVTAYILKKMGYYIEGLFIKNWNKDDNKYNCNSIDDYLMAKKITNKLNIKLKYINLSKYYWNNVFIKFLDDIKLGITPNPDILCNKKIKFNILKKIIDNNTNYDYIATGHYVRKIVVNKRNIILKGIDKKKDQSYFLSSIKSKNINNFIFPLGNFNKEDVRKIAKEINFENYNRKGSTGICFIGKKKFKNFIKNFIETKKGYILNENNKIIGNHDGVNLYTIGQRKGLGIGGIKGYNNKPWYIIEKRIKDNLIIVSQDINNSNLLSKGLIIKNMNWINNKPCINKFIANVKIRYDNSKNDIKSKIEIIDNNHIKIIFYEKSGVVVPGQYAVIYINSICLGGGKIIKLIN
ncbi:tRNA 2-thiouridine(34) synthase MnmA [Candidatus Nardonella dryophthoridicola]|uniref:tRNA-specific 2-thiouridylase MnmA n=1 Tax=endosymbiont of Rhynchophorus ferrugineus TaxID=1972133 RepID=A0A2Z5TPK6_9GAMM|nr:tRNA 2-thiouridine(34) synthase MnmA [Candidatus Nardonella dryophthoridicola]BBA85004.1 tRNA-specific 2-thiouridylase MnmA [endosymbiont of Rhynchophorus ferrugineus]